MFNSNDWVAARWVCSRHSEKKNITAKASITKPNKSETLQVKSEWFQQLSVGTYRNEKEIRKLDFYLQRNKSLQTHYWHFSSIFFSHNISLQGPRARFLLLSGHFFIFIQRPVHTQEEYYVIMGFWSPLHACPPAMVVKDLGVMRTCFSCLTILCLPHVSCFLTHMENKFHLTPSALQLLVYIISHHNCICTAPPADHVVSTVTTLGLNVFTFVW